jgi:hypothetical protein
MVPEPVQMNVLVIVPATGSITGALSFPEKFKKEVDETPLKMPRGRPWGH